MSEERIDRIETTVDEHGKRLNMHDVELNDIKNDSKWIRAIGAAIVSGGIAVGWLIYDVNTKVTFIAGEHRILSQERNE